MGIQSQYWLIVTIGTLGSIWCLFWKTSMNFPNPSVIAKASIQLDLNVPTSSSTSQNNTNAIEKKLSWKKNPRKSLSRFMMQLYESRPNADLIRAIDPHRVTPSMFEKSKIIEFQIPEQSSREILETAELFENFGKIWRVETMDRKISFDLRKSRTNENFRVFDVTSIVKNLNDDILKLTIRTRSFVDRSKNRELPILLLNYGKPKIRRDRAINEDDREDGNAAPWIEDGGRRIRRRNLCRRRSLYVDFAAIAYNEWVVAPPGYEAYQCVGKCFYPFGDHLSPTKHAIVQTLVHGSSRTNDGNKNVGRACCVPTRLAPTSLLYIDATGTLTYQYGYEDMVVAECGCR